MNYNYNQLNIVEKHIIRIQTCSLYFTTIHFTAIKVNLLLFISSPIFIVFLKRKIGIRTKILNVLVNSIGFRSLEPECISLVESTVYNFTSM